MSNLLRIVPVDGSFKRYLVELDGKDISKYISEINFTLRAGKTADVTLKIAAAIVEIPSELEAVVVADKEKSGKEILKYAKGYQVDND